MYFALIQLLSYCCCCCVCELLGGGGGGGGGGDIPGLPSPLPTPV